jgi:hypothetical protein
MNGRGWRRIGGTTKPRGLAGEGGAEEKEAE